MQHTSLVPDQVERAFPFLTDAIFVRQFASAVPLVPDTFFNIYSIRQEEFIALVATDYADPQSQSEELKRITESHAFRFKDIVLPNKQSKVVSIGELDDLNEEFFVVTSYKNHRRYYYAARLEYS